MGMFLPTDESFSSSLNFFKEVPTMSNSLRHSTTRTRAFPPLVLVVEDDADTRLMLKYLLEIWNYQVIVAKDDDEAFQMAIHYQPDLILMSINSEETVRLTNSRLMRETPTLEQTVIIFISAYSDKKVRASALASGGDDYLVKPIDFGVLEKPLENHLRINAKSKETTAVRKSL